jgi:hypothetical protein
MTLMIKRRGLSLTALAVLALGCTADERLVRQAETASERQASQNREIARQNQEFAQATKQLLAHDAEARHEAISLQHDLQAEQSAVGRERDELERERRQRALWRNRDPLIAAAIADLGLLLACLLPLGLCWYLLFALRREPADRELGEILATELVNEESILLPFSEAKPSAVEVLTEHPRPPGSDKISGE